MDSKTRTGNSSGRTFVIVMVVGALVFGLAVGYRLGTQRNDGISVAPTHTSTLSIQPTPSQAPTLEPSFPPLPIQPATVAEALRQAYYVAGAGISVCAFGGAPVCNKRDAVVQVDDAGLATTSFEQLFNAGPAEHLDTGLIAVVEDLNAEQVEGVLYSEGSFPFGQTIPSVNPEQQGIYFLDLRGLDNGRSILVVRSLSSEPLNGDRTFTWHANVIAFDVQRPLKVLPSP